MQENITINSINDIGRVAEKLLAFCHDTRLITFQGEIGAGKTTLITTLCEILEVEDIVSSPTFSIVNVYEGKQIVYHMDLYRLEDIEEALGIGIEEYLDSGHYCFIEWPELIEPILYDLDMVQVQIGVIDETKRSFAFVKSF